MTRALFVRFLLIFLLPATLLMAASALLYHREFRNDKDQTIQDEALYTSQESKTIQNTFPLVVGDLLVLGSRHDMRDMLDGRADDEHLAELEQEMLSFMRVNKSFDQLRILDATGMERMRVDRRHGEPELLAKHLLQDKSKRYYFRSAITLPRNSIFVSPFDLNNEHGVIEKPVKPTIRIARPLVAKNGRHIGVLVLNYLGKHMFDSLHMLASLSPHHQILLLNRQGYWLKGLKPEDEWGFMYDDPSKTIGAQFPAVWRAMQAGPGHLFTPDGLFTFARLKPLARFHPHGIHVATLENPYEWFIVSHIPQQYLFSASHQVLQKLMWGNVVALLLWGLIALYIASIIERRLQAESGLQEQAERTREIVESAFNGIFTIDRGGVIASFNPAACRIFGYSIDEVVGQKIDFLLTEEGHTELQKELAIIQQNKAPHQLSFTLPGRRKDGSSFPMELGLGIRAGREGHRITGILQDITERTRMQEKLRKLAITDPLTGLYNRRHINSSLESEFRRAHRYNLPLAIVMLDIDFFKHVNDTYGHPAGDAVLQGLAAELRRQLRDIDIIGRIGGEEFIMLLPQIPTENARQVAERLRQSVAANSMYTMDGEEMHITISLGVVALPECSCESAEEMMHQADQALYDAKQSGRNRVEVASGKKS